MQQCRLKSRRCSASQWCRRRCLCQAVSTVMHAHNGERSELTARLLPVSPLKPTTTPFIPPALAKAVSKTAPSTTESTTCDILKKEFVDALTPDLQELLQLEIDTMGNDWFVALRGEFVKPYFRDVSLENRLHSPLRLKTITSFTAQDVYH
jgi:hypothetical protein